ncbi:MAG TPA: TIGR03790 family protein, partial [Opitutales bacterium]|nr:TIGR03790 family protein [Opitutales bacterium]
TPAHRSEFVRAIEVPDTAAIARAPMVLHSFASVDSEIAAMPADSNPVFGFIQNPLYRKIQATLAETIHILRTSRLDGVTLADAKGLVDSALEAERAGLDGRVYIDSGGPFPEGDKWLAGAAKSFADAGWDVSFDREKTLFDSGDRFDAPAVYFGWYANGVCGPMTEPGMRFQPGAVALHIHSFSAANLRNGAVWVPGLISRGVAGTAGNVYEPTLILTQNVEILSLALLGGWSFADAAWASTPALSWQGVIIGDPLYRPFPWMSLVNKLFVRPDGEYSNLRKIDALFLSGASETAIGRARELFAARGGYATALSLAQMLVQTQKIDEAAEALSFMATDRRMDAGKRSVALEAARLLVKWGKPDEADAILSNLLSPQTSSSFRSEVQALKAGIEAGRTGAQVPAAEKSAPK